MKKIRYYKAIDRETGKARIIAAHCRSDMTEYVAKLRFEFEFAKVEDIVHLLSQGAELVDLCKEANNGLSGES